MSDYLEFYRKVDPASIQAGRNVYTKVSIPMEDFNAAIEHYGFVKERTCEYIGDEISGGCSECRGWLDQACAYCPSCGAKVVGE